MTRFAALCALTVSAMGLLVGCPAPGADLHAQWAATGKWVQPPELMNTDSSDSESGESLKVLPSSPQVNADERVEDQPAKELTRTYSSGPMVFGPKSIRRYKLASLGSWLPLGSMAMEVMRFEAKGAGFQLELETRYTVAGIPGQQTWRAYLDSAWIQVDGKPMMPQQAEPGMAWPSINGHAYFVGMERVETDVGAFDGCWKVLYAEGAGDPAEYWFAPGLGLVKARFTLAGFRVEALLSEVKG